MATNTLPAFLRDRRERLSPTSTERRRTPGLRREEVAARAGVSISWYTWLEQGRGGTPSADVLERLARALELDEANREMLFLLAHGRPPPRTPTPTAAVTPALQTVLDNLAIPAFVQTPMFQLVAWNRSAAAVFGDCSQVPESERNLLRLAFRPSSSEEEAEEARRASLAAFRVDIARAGPSDEVTALIEELEATSTDFRRLWEEGEIRPHGRSTKRLVRPGVGEIVLDSSMFLLDGSHGLSMFVLSPANEASARALAQLVQTYERQLP